MSNLINAAHRRLAERQAAYTPPRGSVNDPIGSRTMPGSTNPHKGGAPGGRKLRAKGANAKASNRAAST